VDTEDTTSAYVLACSVDLKCIFAPFGAVSAGILTIRGQALPARWYYNEDRLHINMVDDQVFVTGNREYVEAQTGEGTTVFIGWIHQDAVEPMWSNDADAFRTILCFRLRTAGYKRGSMVLLLEIVGDTGSYRRLGILEIGDAIYRYKPRTIRNIFADLSDTIVTII
jgi:hypothetical protein